MMHSAGWKIRKWLRRKENNGRQSDKGRKIMPDEKFKSQFTMMCPSLWTRTLQAARITFTIPPGNYLLNGMSISNETLRESCVTVMCQQSLNLKTTCSKKSIPSRHHGSLPSNQNKHYLQHFLQGLWFIFKHPSSYASTSSVKNSSSMQVIYLKLSFFVYMLFIRQLFFFIYRYSCSIWNYSLACMQLIRL